MQGVVDTELGFRVLVFRTHAFLRSFPISLWRLACNFREILVSSSSPHGFPPLAEEFSHLTAARLQADVGAYLIMAEY